MWPVTVWPVTMWKDAVSGAAPVPTLSWLSMAVREALPFIGGAEDRARPGRRRAAGE